MTDHLNKSTGVRLNQGWAKFSVKEHHLQVSLKLLQFLPMKSPGLSQIFLANAGPWTAERLL